MKAGAVRRRVRGSLQLQIYMLACRDVMGFVPDLATMVFVRHNERISVSYSDIDLNVCRETLEGLVNQVQAVDPEQITTTHCARCRFRQTCKHSTAQESSAKRVGAKKPWYGTVRAPET